MDNNRSLLASGPHRTSWIDSPFVVWIVSLACHVFVGWRYLDAPFIIDDLYYLRDIGLQQSDRARWTDFWLAPHSGYLHAIWRLEFNGLWHLFGANPVAWRVVLGVAHSLTAALIFILLRAYSPSRAIAWTSSLLWASATIGLPENPFLHLMSGEQTMSLLWFLLGMCLVAHRDRLPFRGGPLGLAFCIFFSIMTWGVAATFAPAILAQLILLDNAGTSRHRSRRYWVLGWTLSCLFTIGLQFVLLGGNSANIDGAGEFPFPWQIFVHVATLIVASLSNLLPTASLLGSVNLVLGAFVFIFLLSQFRLLDSTTRSVVLVFSMPTFGFLLALAVFRSGGDLWQGRYLYVPTLSWCVVLGCLIGTIFDQLNFSRTRRFVWAASTCSAFLLGQRSLANAAREQCDQSFSITSQAIADYSTLFQHLAASNADTRPAIPDVPLLLPPHMTGYFSVSAFLAVFVPDLTGTLSIVAIDQPGPTELDDLKSQLTRLPNPAAISLAASIDRVPSDLELFKELDALAAKDGMPIHLGRLKLGLPSLGLELEVHEAFAHGVGQLPRHLDFTGNATTEGWMRLLELLESARHPLRFAWMDCIRTRLFTIEGSTTSRPKRDMEWTGMVQVEGDARRFVNVFETPEAFGPVYALFPTLKHQSPQIAYALAPRLWPNSNPTIGRVLRDPVDIPSSTSPLPKSIREALQQLDQGNLAAAEATLQEYLKSSPPGQDADPGIRNARFILVVMEMELGRLDQAATLLRDIAQRDGSLAEVHFLLGTVLIEQGKHEAAAKELLHALALHPGYVAANQALGMLYLRSGKREEARERLFRAATSLPLDRSLRQSLERIGTTDAGIGHAPRG